MLAAREAEVAERVRVQEPQDGILLLPGLAVFPILVPHVVECDFPDAVRS